ncbi:MAG: ATP-binding protein [Pseudomonadota bacterium]
MIALLMTVLQITLDFRAEVSAQKATIRKVERSILPGFVESLWILDAALLEAQLKGIAQLDDVTRVHLTDAAIEIDIVNSETLTSRPTSFPVQRMTPNGLIALGTVTLYVTQENLWEQVLYRTGIVLATNFLKAVCIVIVILLIFQRLVGRHITTLARYVGEYDPRQRNKELVLPSAGILSVRAHDCEFGDLENAINSWTETTEGYIGQLRNANQEQAEFTYAISHDLKAPTNTMAMLIEELEERLVDGETTREILADMQITNRRMSQLIEDVLSYSRLIDQYQAPEPIDLQQMISDIQKDVAAEINASQAKIVVGPLPMLEGHPVQIRMLLQNLIANALKFRAKDRAPLIEISGNRSRDAINLWVQDNGIGIDAKHQEEVFGLFKRLHARTEYEGSGLGLAICRRVMSNHNGTIKMRSVPEGGTRVSLSFPVRSG